MTYHAFSLSLHPVFPGHLSSWCPWMDSEQSIWKIMATTSLSSTSCVSHQHFWTPLLFRIYSAPWYEWTLMCCRKCRNNNTIHEACLPDKDIPKPLHYCDCKSFLVCFIEPTVDLLDPNGWIGWLVLTVVRKNSIKSNRNMQCKEQCKDIVLGFKVFLLWKIRKMSIEIRLD